MNHLNDGRSTGAAPEHASSCGSSRLKSGREVVSICSDDVVGDWGKPTGSAKRCCFLVEEAWTAFAMHQDRILRCAACEPCGSQPRHQIQPWVPFVCWGQAFREFWIRHALFLSRMLWGT